MKFSKEVYLEENGGEFDGLVDKEWAEECDGVQVSPHPKFSGEYLCIGNETGYDYIVLKKWCTE